MYETNDRDLQGSLGNANCLYEGFNTKWPKRPFKDNQIKQWKSRISCRHFRHYCRHHRCHRSQWSILDRGEDLVGIFFGKKNSHASLSILEQFRGILKKGMMRKGMLSSSSSRNCAEHSHTWWETSNFRLLAFMMWHLWLLARVHNISPVSPM